MQISRAYKTELDPTPAQVEDLYRFGRVTRMAYNWAFSLQERHYAEHKKRLPWKEIPHLYRAQRNEILQQEAEPEDPKELYQWRTFRDEPTVSTYCMQSAIADLKSAYAAHFRALGERKAKIAMGKDPGPRPEMHYRSARHGDHSFRLYGIGSQHIESGTIQLPRLGRVKVHQRDYLPNEHNTPGLVKINGVTITWKAGRWFVSVNVLEEVSDPVDRTAEPPLYLMAGTSPLAALPTGECVVPNLQPLQQAQERLYNLQIVQARAEKGSKNWQKLKLKIQKVYYRIACLRKEALHQATTALVRQHGVISLNRVEREAREAEPKTAAVRRDNREYYDAAPYEFQRQLDYKLGWRGGRLLIREA